MKYSLLVLGGKIPRSLNVKKLANEASLVVAADGAAHGALSRGVKPDVIAGDLDSIGKLGRDFRGVTIVYDPSQDDTDFDKSLRYLLYSKKKEVVVVGAFGGRTDHSLNMMSVAARFADQIKIIFLNEDGLIHVLPVGWYSFRSRLGETISLIPVGVAEGITTEALAYPLEGERLALGERDGISNQAIDNKFSVGLRGGVLLLFREHHEFEKYF